MEKTYKVFTLKLADKLRKQGFRIVDVQPNKDKPWFNVYCFENTAELRAAIEALTA